MALPAAFLWTSCRFRAALLGEVYRTRCVKKPSGRRNVRWCDADNVNDMGGVDPDPILVGVEEPNQLAVAFSIAAAISSGGEMTLSSLPLVKLIVVGSCFSAIRRTIAFSAASGVGTTEYTGNRRRRVPLPYISRGASVHST